jgi:hypothetical protein
MGLMAADDVKSKWPDAIRSLRFSSLEKLVCVKLCRDLEV